MKTTTIDHVKTFGLTCTFMLIEATFFSEVEAAYEYRTAYRISHDTGDILEEEIYTSHDFDQKKLITATFDDILAPGENFAQLQSAVPQYKGLDWHDMGWVLNSSALPYESGYYSVGKGSGVLYNWGGNETLTISSSRPFIPISMKIGTAWPNVRRNQGMVIYESGSPKNYIEIITQLSISSINSRYDGNWNSASDPRDTYIFDKRVFFRPVKDLVFFVSSDGVDQNINHFAIDDFKFVFVDPPPSPPKNIIVLTHGWNDAGNGLSEIKSAIDSRVASSGLADRTEVIHYIWTGAQTGFSPEAYIEAHGRTQYAGSNLAMKIAEIVGEGRRLDPDYDPIIHFIGHSLGTHVNAYAVKTLGESVTVEQFTILDSPLHPISHAAFFRDKLSGGSVEYVENFYVDELLKVRFGSPIAGAGPCIGASTERACNGIAVGGGWDHSSIASDFYPRLISGGDPSDIPSLLRPWNSPILEGWRPDVRWDSDAAFEEIRRLIQQVAAEIPESAVRQIRGSVSTEVRDGALFVTLTPNSPAEFEVLLDVPLNAYALLLDIDATKDSLATLEVYLDGQLRWTWSTGSFESGLFTAEIDVSGLGDVTNLSFVYDPAGVLDPLVVSNFRFAVLTAVPEPTTKLAMAVGLFLLFAKSASSVARRNGLRRNGGVSGTQGINVGFFHGGALSLQ